MAFANAVVISDSDFHDADWSVRNDSSRSGTAVGAQVPIGGNRGSYRELGNSGFQPGAGGAFTITTGWHFYEADAYDPAGGALASVSLSEDILRSQDPMQVGRLAIRQGGILFRSTASYTVSGATNTWSANLLEDLVESDFEAFLNGSFLPNGDPDFSRNGSPITFGVYRETFVGFRGSYNSRSGIDNFRVELTIDVSGDNSSFVPLEPASTYLEPADPREDLEAVKRATRLDLASGLPFAVEPGDYVRLQALGDFDFAVADDNLGGPFGDGTLADVWAVFSSSDRLLSESMSDRVPDKVVPTEGDFILLDSGENDIAGDFIVPNPKGQDKNGVVVRVPEGVTHLFFGAADQVWGDNSDPNGTETEPDYGVQVTRLYEGRALGDYNADGVVDAADYTVWRDALGAEFLLEHPADGNFDGVIDVLDYQVWIDGFGSTISSSASAVPEPSAVCLALWTVLAIAGRRPA